MRPRESGFHRKLKRMIHDAGLKLGYEAKCEKHLSVLSKRLVVDVAYTRNGRLSAVFEVERGYTWDTMHVLGHIVALNLFAQTLSEELPCVFVFDENRGPGTGGHTSTLLKTWSWYTQASGQKKSIRLHTIPVYWDRSVTPNTRSITVEWLTAKIAELLP
ncbi:MAG: hypothetical protein QW514_00215 [Thermoprotei archaeon]